jgi:WD40 repeat protein
MKTESARAIKIFCCYAPEDEALLVELIKHLASLERSGQITIWYAGKIPPGTEQEPEIDQHLKAADLILLLMSADFISSNFLGPHDYSRVIRQVLERHKEGKACVIPVIARYCLWEETPVIGGLKPLPAKGRAITKWRNRGEAYEDVARGIKAAILDQQARGEQSGEAKDAVTIIKTVADELPAQPVEKEPDRTPDQEEIDNSVANTNERVARSLEGSSQHLPPPPPATLSLPQEPQGPKPASISRRIIIQLLAGIAAASGSIVLFEVARRSHQPASNPLPMGTTLVTYTGHTDDVNAVAWSPDGTRIASGSEDQTVQVWDATTGGNVLYSHHPFDEVHNVAWSPDGTRIASAGSYWEVWVWNATTAAGIYSYSGHLDEVTAVAWSPDSMRIASASYDKTVRVWDATTGNNVLIYSHHTAPVYAVAWSPDGKYIASASDDKKVRVWDATTGNNVFVYSKHTAPVYAVSWSPDSRSRNIASGGGDSAVRVWDATTGGAVLPNAYTSHTGYVNTVSWSPDGTRIASGSNDKTVQIWNATTGKWIYTYSHHTAPVNAVAWSSGGSYIASASDDKTVRVWQAV